ncbi:MAG: triose-phosphate isomerase [Defluviitaleaceae bacterium]|nr:triose-phosphate isomerase [Defluviitaleaceae bacterium]
MRKKIVAGNWKMNNSPKEAVAFANSIKDGINGADADVVFCVPFVSLAPVMEALKGTDIAVGAQNMHYEDSGAYTGEISAKMLAEMGVPYVIIGHSERRQYFGETDETVNLKTKKALANGLIPIVCLGETLVQREQGITVDLVRLQTRIALRDVSKEDAKKVVIAYEPIWAIGTGKTATDQQAEEACAAVRQVLSEIYDAVTANAIRIQYGGSVTADNAKALFAMPNIDGGLVGGASLKPDFEVIARA